MTRRFTSALAILGLTLALSACKQGEGERCQIDDDCEDGLECNASTMECQSTGGQVFDAAPIPDGPPAADADTTDAGDTADANPFDADTTDADTDASR
jgi:hypothetical protein